jgi:hypothetical protein
MAISKVAQISAAPTAVSDYEAQNDHIDAFINQIAGGYTILTEWDSTTVPEIAQGAYIAHGGVLYVVDTEDYSIGAGDLSATGDYYVRLTVDGDNLTAAWESSLTGFTWNASYQGLYEAGGDQLLPYLVGYTSSGTTYEKYKILNPASETATKWTLISGLGRHVVNVASSGNVYEAHRNDSMRYKVYADDTTTVVTANNGNNLGLSTSAGETSSPVHIFIEEDTGNVGIGDGTNSPGAKLDVNGSLACDTVNTGQGNNKLYAMNQNLRTTDSPTFDAITLSAGMAMSVSYVNYGYITSTTTIGDMEVGEVRVYVVTSSDMIARYLRTPSTIDARYMILATSLVGGSPEVNTGEIIEENVDFAGVVDDVTIYGALLRIW